MAIDFFFKLLKMSSNDLKTQNERQCPNPKTQRYYIFKSTSCLLSFPGGSVETNPPADAEDRG